MLIPLVSIDKFVREFGFKKCRKPYNKDCYYLCNARSGGKMIFLSTQMLDIINWRDNDPRIHKRANCRYSDKRDVYEILCEMIKKGYVGLDYLGDRRKGE